ncbi:glutathione S-transferase family protein [Maritalea sp.]|uniref:glutathione S-transferase family protein n=1 Tax=Maritalea sp. TaxID=2003361 RepID=UPI003EF827AA
MEKLTLFGQRGWGSVVVEAQLAWYGVDYEFVQVGHLFEDEAARVRLEEINPRCQIPTLQFADGQVMTEIGAITLWMAEQHESDGLVPAPRCAERREFLRWLFYMVSSIHPTYNYVDDPARFVDDEVARAQYEHTVNDFAKKLYGILEDHIVGPYMLGDRFSALDIYTCGMVHWSPGRKWYEANAPRMVEIADKVQKMGKLDAVWRENYPNDYK